MAGFGGSVKLTGESEYKQALKQITQNLKEVASEMKVVNSAYEADDRSMAAVNARTEALNKTLGEQEKKLAILQKQYESMSGEYAENTNRHNQLVASYEKEKAKLDEIGRTLGTSSKEYKEQEQKVTDLESAVIKSTKAQEDNERAMSKMRTEINNAQADINKTTNEIDKMSQSLDEEEKEAKEAGKETENYGETAKKVGEVAAAAFAAMVTAATALVTALGDCVKETMSYGNEVDKMSQKVGLSAEAYQKWDYALQIAGTEMSAMRTGLKTLTNTFDDARNGTASAIEKFERLGLSMEDIQDLSREELFETTIKALQNVADETEQAAIANDFFGRSGQDLIPILNMTAEETDALLKKAEDLGGVMSGEDVKAAATLTDSMTSLKTAFNGIKREVGSSFIPALTGAVDGITQVISGGKDGVETFKQSIQDIVEVIKQGDALKGVTEMISGLSSLLVEAIKGFIQALPSLLAEIPTLVGDLLDSVLDLIEEVNWGEVFLGILNAALGVIGSIFQTLTDHQTEATEEWARHRDAIYEYIAAGEEALAAAQALSDQREEAYDSLYAEIGLMEDIKDKLIEYTDEQGHVKEGYEDDLAALVALADAQGIHIEVIDGEIQYYQDLITSIDDAIEKRKAEAITAAETSLYEEAYKERRRLEGEYRDHYEKYIGYLAEADRALQEGRTEDNQKYMALASEELVAANALKDGIVEYSGQMELASHNMAAAAQGDFDDLATTYDQAGIDIQTYYDELENTNDKIIKDYEDTYSTEIPEAIKNGDAKAYAQMTTDWRAQQMIAETMAFYTGQAVDDGMADGINANASKVVNAAGGVMNSAINRARNIAQIQSPSKVFKKMGEYLTEGLAEGIEDGTQEALDATTELMEGISSIGSSLNIGQDITSGMTDAISGINTIPSNSTSNSININVYGAEGQDVNALADTVINKIQLMLGRSNAVYG